ncbi:hypothetical protein [Rhizobium binxianense]
MELKLMPFASFRKVARYHQASGDDFVIIVTPVTLHGIAVTPVMRWIDRKRGVDGMANVR